MNEPQTQPQMQPPDRNGGGIALAEEDDREYIKELGDKIANLTMKQAVELSAYIDSRK